MKNNKFDEVIKTLLEAEKTKKDEKKAEKRKKDEKVKKSKKDSKKKEADKTLRKVKEETQAPHENIFLSRIFNGARSMIENSVYFDKEHKKARKEAHKKFKKAQ